MIMRLESNMSQLILNIMEERECKPFALLWNEIENSEKNRIFGLEAQPAPQCIGSRAL